MIEVGIAGCGYWGSKHLRVFNELPGARVAAVCDMDADRLERISGSYPLAITTQDYDEMLAGDVQAVVIATPAKTHFAMAKKALLRNKHVLVEKPFTTTTAQALELIQLAEEKGRTIMVGHTFLFSPPVRALKKLIQSGHLGRILYIHSARLNFGLLQPDVNVLWDLAPHDISIVLHLMDETPVAVGARGIGYLNRRLSEVAHADLLFSDSVLAHIHVSWLEPSKVRRFTVIGTERMAVFDDMANGEPLKIYDREVKLSSQNGGKPDTPTYIFGDIRIPHIGNAEPLREECSHFLDCILTGEAPVSDGWAGLQVVGVLESLQRSLGNHGAMMTVGLNPAEDDGVRPFTAASTLRG